MTHGNTLDYAGRTFDETVASLSLNDADREALQRRLNRDAHERGTDRPFQVRVFDDNDEGILHYHPLLLIAADEFERRVWFNGMWQVIAGMTLPARIELEDVRAIFVHGGGRYGVNFLRPGETFRSYRNFYQLAVDVEPEPDVVIWSKLEPHNGQSPEEALNLVRRFANGWGEASRRKLKSLFRR